MNPKDLTRKAKRDLLVGDLEWSLGALLLCQLIPDKVVKHLSLCRVYPTERQARSAREQNAELLGLCEKLLLVVTYQDLKSQRDLEACIWLLLEGAKDTQVIAPTGWWGDRP